MLGRKTGGRQKGTPNKATVEIRTLAQDYGPAIVNRLAMMAGLAVDALGQPIKGAENEATQLAAMKELLDRGYGRATTILATDEAELPLSVEFCWQDATSQAASDLPTTTAGEQLVHRTVTGPTQEDAGEGSLALLPDGILRH